MEDALDRYGALLDELTADLDDPAPAFAQSFRLSGRLKPELSLLRMLGLSAAEASELCRRPLPDLAATGPRDSAA